MSDSNCTIEEHLLALYGHIDTRQQILENLNCTIPEDRWVDLDKTMKAWPEQKETFLSTENIEQLPEKYTLDLV